MFFGNGGRNHVYLSAGFQVEGSQNTCTFFCTSIQESTAEMGQPLLARLDHPIATLESVHTAAPSGMIVTALMRAIASATLICC